MKLAEIALITNLESEGDWNRASFASQIRFDAINLLHGFLTGQVVRMERIRHPRLAAVMVYHVHFIRALAQFPHLVKVVVNEFVDRLGLLIGHNANRELARHFTRDDRLGAWLTKCSLNTVQRKGRETPAVHQRLGLKTANKKANNCSI